ncbi:MAG: LysR family transcriptional regulator [Lachnospiraceae bacterium]|nr:LysR family transcriptional regulator [Lachnospiraceae bacterium]MDY4969277.1 LysR family transcriptional regulator [Lachnospiraceae bacterium]
MDITYDYYRIFYYVARYSSFTRAADILMNSQPNITRSMNNLEKQLGCSLFIRSNRGIKLTREGKLLFKHVSVAYEQLHTAELELSNTSLENGIVTVSASETALHGILLPVLTEFHSLYPGVRIRITNESTPQAVQTIKNGLADFAIVTTPADVKRPLKETKLKDFEEILVCGKQYAFLSEGMNHLEDLQNFPFICLGKHTKTYEFFSDFYMKQGLVFKPDIEAATADQIIPMAIHNLGIGFVPDTMLEAAGENKELFVIPLAEKVPTRSICLVEDTSHPLSTAASRLKAMLSAPPRSDH